MIRPRSVAGGEPREVGLDAHRRLDAALHRDVADARHLGEPTFYLHVLVSLRRILIGYLLAGVLGGCAVSVAIELTVYRTLRSRRAALINIMIATLGVSIILQNVARLIWGSEPLRYPALFESRGVTIAGFVVSPQLVWIFILSAGLIAAGGAGTETERRRHEQRSCRQREAEFPDRAVLGEPEQLRRSTESLVFVSRGPDKIPMGSRHVFTSFRLVVPAHALDEPARAKRRNYTIVFCRR